MQETTLLTVDPLALIRIFAAIGFAKEKTFLFKSINSIIALIAQGICVAFCDKVSLKRRRKGKLMDAMLITLLGGWLDWIPTAFDLL